MYNPARTRHKSNFLRLYYYAIVSLYIVADWAVSNRIGFYRAAWNATRSYDEISVCPSVRPSVKRVHCDKTEERYV